MRGKATVPGGLERLSYSFRSPEVFAEAGTVPESPVKLGADGSFSFVAVTRGLKGPQELHLRARDRQGREGECSVSLLPGDGDIPGFRVEPGNGRLTLSWDPLPGSGPYTLIYRIENPRQPPGRERQINGLRSPYVLAGLENGNLYAARLKTGIAGEEDAWSATRTAVPFSPWALAAQGEYRRIRLSWEPLPACESYEIWRATAAGGVYGQVAGPVTGGAYLDEEVRYGTKYFYQVRPTGLPNAGSRIAGTQILELPSQRVEARGFCSLAGLRGISAYGGYVFAAAGAAGLQIIDVADSSSPALVGGCPTESANAVVVRGELACVADGERGLATMDVSDPRSPRFLGARKTTDARAVYLRHEHAFVADGPGGLKVLDLSDPSQPARLAAMETLDAWDLVGRGSLLFLADGRGGFLTVDATDPLGPGAAGPPAEPGRPGRGALRQPRAARRRRAGAQGDRRFAACRAEIRRLVQPARRGGRGLQRALGLCRRRRAHGGGPVRSAPSGSDRLDRRRPGPRGGGRGGLRLFRR